MRKLTVAVALLALPLLLAGCMAASLEYSLNSQGQANTLWKLEASPSGEHPGKLEKQGIAFAWDKFTGLVSQWTSQGIAATTSESNGTVTLTGRLNSQGSREQSFLQLASWMQSDELSPFSSVKSNHTTTEYVEEYVLDATIDWKDIIDPSTLSTVPADLRAGAESVLQDGTVSVSLSLPGKAVESQGKLTQANGMSTCTVITAPGKPARIMLHTRIENELKPKSIASAASLRQWSLVAACALGGLLMLFFAGKLVSKMRRNRY